MNMKHALGIPAGLVLLAVTLSQAQVPQQAGEKPPKSDETAKPMMQCPMMAGMQGLKMYADSPAVLLWEADDLKLTDKQKKRLRKIADSARQKALKLMTPEQQAKLKKLPNEPMSIMDLSMARMKDKMDHNMPHAMMCPMCMQMMQKMQKMKMMQKKTESKNPGM